MSRKVLLLLLLAIGTVFMAGCVVMPSEPRHWGFPSDIFPFGLLGIALYFLPTIIAAVRHKKDILVYSSTTYETVGSPGSSPDGNV